jgi:hypothetical protein
LETTLLGKSLQTGTEITKGGFEANYKLHGFGLEEIKEKAPNGEIKNTSKFSITLYALTFERSKSSDGSWSESLKISASFFRSFLIGFRAEGSLSLININYQPHKTTQ